MFFFYDYYYECITIITMAHYYMTRKERKGKGIL